MELCRIENFSINNMSMLFPSEEAQEHYKKSFEILHSEDLISDSDMTRLFFNASVFKEYCERQRFLRAQAREHILKAIELDPNYPGFYRMLGELYFTDAVWYDGFDWAYKAENRDAAIANYSKAIELNPNFSDENFPAGTAQLHRGWGYVFKYDDEDKEEFLEQACADFEAAEALGVEISNEQKFQMRMRFKGNAYRKKFRNM